MTAVEVVAAVIVAGSLFVVVAVLCAATIDRRESWDAETAQGLAEQWEDLHLDPNGCDCNDCREAFETVRASLLQRADFALWELSLSPEDSV